MKLVPGIKYLKGNDGFIYAFNAIKAQRKDMTAFIAEGDETQPITPLVEKKLAQKEEVRKAKARGRAKKSRSRKKKPAVVAESEKTPVTAEAQRPDAS